MDEKVSEEVSQCHSVSVKHSVVPTPSEWRTGPIDRTRCFCCDAPYIEPYNRKRDDMQFGMVEEGLVCEVCMDIVLELIFGEKVYNETIGHLPFAKRFIQFRLIKNRL